MIPDETTVLRIDSRPHPGVEAETVREYLQAAIDRVAAKRSDGRYEMVLADRKDSYLIEREHPLVESLDAAFQQVTGQGAPLRRRLVARRHGELRQAGADGDLRPRARPGLHAERVARHGRHQAGGDGQHRDDVMLRTARIELGARHRSKAIDGLRRSGHDLRRRPARRAVPAGHRQPRRPERGRGDAVVLRTLGAEVAAICRRAGRVARRRAARCRRGAMGSHDVDVIFELTSIFAGSSQARRDACARGARYITVPGLLADAPPGRSLRRRLQRASASTPSGSASSSTRPPSSTSSSAAGHGPAGELRGPRGPTAVGDGRRARGLRRAARHRGRRGPGRGQRRRDASSSTARCSSSAPTRSPTPVRAQFPRRRAGRRRRAAGLPPRRRPRECRRRPDAQPGRGVDRPQPVLPARRFGALELEGIVGGAHVALGNNVAYGGSVAARSHIDCILLRGASCASTAEPVDPPWPVDDHRSRT